MMVRCLLWKTGMALLTLTAVAPGIGEELRVDTDIFVGNASKPIAQNVTLFSSGLVYDFCETGPEEITVLDPARGRFVLLDQRRKVKTTITTRRLLEFTSAMKVQAREMDGVFAFAAEPRFEQKFDSETGWLTLSGDMMTYRAKCIEPKTADLVTRYRTFADWSARLNAMRPGNLPPFARIALNKAIADADSVAEEVELTVEPQNRYLGRKLVLRSRHLLNWRLSHTDRKRIDRAGECLAEFEPVDWEQFRKVPEVAAR